MSIFAGLIAVASAVVAAEEKYLAPYLAAQLKAHLPKPTAVMLPPAYSAVLLVNLVGATVVLIVLGMRVGKARKAFKIEVRCGACGAARVPAAALPCAAQMRAAKRLRATQQAFTKPSQAPTAAFGRAPRWHWRKELQRLHFAGASHVR
jgi:hypothetical protein